MTVLSGQSIRVRGIFTPFSERAVAFGMSYGLGAAGYDVRIAENMLLHPGEFALASTVEHFTVPTDLMPKVYDKSTWARRGLSLFNTVAEPGWRGFLTLELKNQGREVLAFRRGMPIAQIIFQLLDAPAKKPYSGKYQDKPAGPQRARFEP